MSNAKDNGGAMCGGVINDTLFKSDPMAYMMAYVMPDDKFEEYKKLKEADTYSKEAKELFDKYAYSAI